MALLCVNESLISEGSVGITRSGLLVGGLVFVLPGNSSSQQVTDNRNFDA